MFTYETLARRLEFYSLDELLQIGLERARILQSYYENWDGSHPDDIATIEQTLSNSEEALKGFELSHCLMTLSESSYTAAARAAAAYRRTRSLEAKHAQFAGTATHLLADALIERNRDFSASRDYAIQSIAATFKAEADGISFEAETVIVR